MDKSKPITYIELVPRQTVVKLEDALNALSKRMKEISRLAASALENLKKIEMMIDSDPILRLLYAICDDDIEALNQIVSKYHLDKRNLSDFERELVRQQLPKQPGIDNPNEFHDPIIEIAYSAVLIWLSTFSLNYSAYFSLPQGKREKILVGIMARACHKQFTAGEFIDPRKRADITPEELGQGYDEDDEGKNRSIKRIESQAWKSGTGQLPWATYDNPPEDDLLDMSKLGLDIDTLTPKEIALLYDALKATNQGVEVGSNQGYSLRQYWGKEYTKNIKMLERIKAKRQKT